MCFPVINLRSLLDCVSFLLFERDFLQTFAIYRLKLTDLHFPICMSKLRSPRSSGASMSSARSVPCRWIATSTHKTRREGSQKLLRRFRSTITGSFHLWPAGQVTRTHLRLVQETLALVKSN